METNTLDILTNLFYTSLGIKASDIQALAISGSNRKYFRLKGGEKSAIGVYHEDKKENTAFLAFTRHFLGKGLPVPQIYGEQTEDNVYLLEDLGDITLFSTLPVHKKGKEFPLSILERYKEVVGILPEFQVVAGKDLDYSLCYPRAAFDRQSMLWDLNYFKYYFLKLAKIPFDEQALEDDFSTFCAFLLEADHAYFMYRDFQSRNIMIHQDKAYFIDYQGGRRGALQYDLASLLFDAKADLPPEVREELLGHYIKASRKLYEFDEIQFRKYFYPYVYIRIIQAMGAYGFRGFYEKKEHFLQSIPFALGNIQWLLENHPLPPGLPVLTKALEGILNSEFLKGLTSDKLTISIQSFSYHSGIPQDQSGHGGGYVFDCRALPNPGRIEKFKRKTGRDKDIADFLENEEEVSLFMQNVFRIIDQSVKKYMERNFTHLHVSFGCTGGQHRSVFMAEKLAQHLGSRFNVEIELQHMELEKMPWLNP